jgi:hypothetical protein
MGAGMNDARGSDVGQPEAIAAHRQAAEARSSDSPDLREASLISACIR